MHPGVDSFWFQDYLCNRFQSVRIGNKVSSSLPRKYGVHQGSVLRPILFNIYVNALAEIVDKCFIVQYADDTQYFETDSIDHLLQLIKRSEQTISKIKHYINMNGLLLNSKKTQCIFVGNRALILKNP